jgi:ATP-binding cassette subfamily B protein
MSSHEALRRFEAAAAEQAWRPPAKPADVADAPRDAIRFENVAFAYPGSERRVLDGLDLTIPAGRSLAIVGINGAGKTTLVKLLARLAEPDGGRITVDAVDLRDVDPQAWRARLGAIFQDFLHYELSVRDNVGFGAPHLLDDADRVRAVVERVGADGFVQRLPRGYDTTLSRTYADGADLSGGQWQRLAIARALMAVEGGASVLVMDEPTANLDVRAEAAFYDRFLELTSGLTTILISHRFSTVRRADRIAVLAGGRVVEEGTHDELVAQGGRYARMFRLQAERFRVGAA